MLKKWLLIVIWLVTSGSYALDLELTQGINSALPIGVDSFGTLPQASELTDVINHDLALTGQFNMIAPPRNSDHSVAQWKSNGADSVLIGAVNQVSGDRFSVSFKLLDAAAHGNILTSGSFQVSSKELRALSHHISDLVYEKLIGEKGIFSTRLAYILVQRQGKMQRYSLEIADVDGNNPQTLLVSGEAIMSPSWSPNGKKIAYVSFEKKKAQVYVVEVSTGKRQLITSFNGLNNAPSWSPDGQQLALVLSKGGNPKIYSVELATGSLKQLTFGESIDTEPRFAPDGRSIIFTSGRGGTPQIYSLNLQSGGINRLTYSGKYNARASFTPDQKRIVMMHRDEDRRFNIAVQDLDNNQVLVLTSSESDESPSVAPNGRFVIYATHNNDLGVLGLTSIDGRTQARLPSRNGDVQEPAWSPFL